MKMTVCLSSHVNFYLPDDGLDLDTWLEVEKKPSRSSSYTPSRSSSSQSSLDKSRDALSGDYSLESVLSQICQNPIISNKIRVSSSDIRRYVLILAVS